jgi:hypothetical protein
MAHTPDLASCLSPADGDRQLLPISPFYALHYHFGMLLGVEDFETEQAYHRGKMRLHNAWLHREGVVWGLGVTLDQAKGEVRVARGLALDGAGHELHLEGDACVNLGAWFDKHRDDAELTVTDNDGKLTFDAHVVISHRACLTRQVPALMEPCEGRGSDTAYSRVFETVEILLKPGKAPDAPPLPYHRLRLLYGLEPPREASGGGIAPEDQDILDQRNAVLAKPAAEQPAAWLELFRRCAALDEIEMQPAVFESGSDAEGEPSLFPALEETPVVLAEIPGIALEKQGEAWVVSAGAVHNDRRPSHVATRTIQELTCAALLASRALVPDAGGPRVDGASVVFEPKQVLFKVDRDLLEPSVAPEAFAVSGYDETNGWQVANVKKASWDAAARSVTLELTAQLKGKAKRLVARGTGERPLLGSNFVPLAGATVDPPATAHDGRDFVFMQLGS